MDGNDNIPVTKKRRWKRLIQDSSEKNLFNTKVLSTDASSLAFDSPPVQTNTVVLKPFEAEIIELPMTKRRRWKKLIRVGRKNEQSGLQALSTDAASSALDSSPWWHKHGGGL